MISPSNSVLKQELLLKRRKNLKLSVLGQAQPVKLTSPTNQDGFPSSGVGSAKRISTHKVFKPMESSMISPGSKRQTRVGNKSDFFLMDYFTDLKGDGGQGDKSADVAKDGSKTQILMKNESMKLAKKGKSGKKVSTTGTKREDLQV